MAARDATIATINGGREDADDALDGAVGSLLRARRNRAGRRIALGVAGGAAAADFPDRPIKLIVPFGPGGPPDVAARIIGAYLSEHLGPVVVENHVGAGGTLAARLVATSPPDGYTLLAATAGSLSISPQLYKDAGIDPLKDFTAVALVSSAPLVLAVQQVGPRRTASRSWSPTPRPIPAN